MIGAALRNAILADPTLVGMLASYRGGPAVFLDRRAPIGFASQGKPYVVSSGDSEASEYLDGERDFVALTRMVAVAGEANGDADGVEAAAWRCREALENREAWLVAGWTVAIGGVAVDGPVEADPDDVTYARQLAVRLWLTKG